MKLLIIKLSCFFACVPFYLFHLFANWYEKAGNGVKMDWRKESKDYWQDVKKILLYRKRS